jgi:hypothetical protein
LSVFISGKVFRRRFFLLWFAANITHPLNFC